MGTISQIKHINFLGAVNTAKMIVRGVPGPPGSVGGSLPWGNITGSIANQTDLSNALREKESLNTGYVSGLELSINTDTTKFDIAEGVYEITTYADLEAPVVTDVHYDGITGASPEFLLTNNASYIALNAAGAIVQSSSPFTNEQRRSLATVGAVIHSDNTVINVVNQIKAPLVASTNQLHDFIKAVGPLNIDDGNVYTNNGADLKIDRSSGTIWGLGINPSDYTNPHALTLAADVALTTRYRLQDGTEYTDTTAIDPNYYDVSGVKTALLANKFSIQHINLFQSGITRIQYGQTEYATLDAAKEALNTETFVVEQNIADNAIFRSYLIVRQGTTNLQDAIDSGYAQFIPVDKFGAAIGAGVTIADNALISDVFLLTGSQVTGEASGSTSSYSPFPNKYHLISGASASDIHTMTISAANLLGSEVGRIFVIQARADSYPEGKILRLTTGQFSIDLTRGDSALIQWNGGTSYAVVSTHQTIFSGRLAGYKESDDTVTFTAGAASVDGSTCDNILDVESLTQDSVITITGTIPKGKPITLPTVADTGGPWTLSVVYNGKTTLLTRNGAGTAALETHELWSDGTDIYTPDAGGTVWSVGT